MTKAMDLIKLAYSLTDVGHKYDEESNRAIKESLEKKLAARKKYKESGGVIPSMLTRNAVFGEEVGRNRAAYLENKHKRKSNSYNPFAGLSDKSYYNGAGNK